MGFWIAVPWLLGMVNCSETMTPPPDDVILYRPCFWLSHSSEGRLGFCFNHSGWCVDYRQWFVRYLRRDTLLLQALWSLVSFPIDPDWFARC